MGPTSILCSGGPITVHLSGEAAHSVEPELVRHAAASVLYFFKKELGREQVTPSEFSVVLEKVLSDFGAHVEVWVSQTPDLKPRRVASRDLRQLADESASVGELIFFPRLRTELRESLKQSPDLLHFSGLRGCVKSLIGARRWSQRCQFMHDQIVDYLRTSLSAESKNCGLYVE